MGNKTTDHIIVWQVSQCAIDSSMENMGKPEGGPLKFISVLQ